MCREVQPDYNVVSATPAAKKNYHLSSSLVSVHELPLRSTLLEEQADPTDNFRRARPVFHDSHGSFARLFHIGTIARKPAQTGVGVGNGGGNRLIHFVRQRSRQLSHGGHPAHVCEIRPHLTPALPLFTHP